MKNNALSCSKFENWNDVFLIFGRYLFTLAVVLCPVLLLYKAFSTVTYFDVLSFIACVLIFVGLLIRGTFFCLFRDCFVKLIPFTFVVAISIVFSSCLFGFRTDVLLRTFRYIYYLLLIIFFSKYFKIKFGFRLYEIFCVFSTIFIFIQFFCLKITGYYISGYVKFLPMIDEYLKSFGQNSSLAVIRPRSFFQEPAHYATYVSIFMFIDYMYLKRNKLSGFIDLFLFFGIVVSSSTTGIVMGLICILFYYVALLMKKNKKELIFYSILFFAGLVFLIILFLLGKLDNLIEKVTSVGSFLARFDSYRHIFDFSTVFSGFISLSIGRGMVPSGIYFAGFSRILFYFGLIGLFSFSYSLVTNRKFLPYVIFFIILNLGTECALGPFAVLFFTTYLSLGRSEPFLFSSLTKRNDIRYLSLRI